MYASHTTLYMDKYVRVALARTKFRWTGHISCKQGLHVNVGILSLIAPSKISESYNARKMASVTTPTNIIRPIFK